MSSKRLKLLLIRGLGHSGTTMLDLALGAHPQIIGLGEAARILATPQAGDEHRGPSQLRGSHRFERRCTCGAVAADCPVWGPQLEWLRLHDQRPMQEKVQQLLEGSPHGGALVACQCQVRTIFPEVSLHRVSSGVRRVCASAPEKFGVAL